MKIQKNNYPWNHYIVDDFLSEERFDYINKLVLDEKKYLDFAKRFLHNCDDEIILHF